MDLSGYLAVAKRWWWTLIVAAWIAGLTGYLVATTIQPTYEAQVKVLVGPLNTDTDTLRASGLLVQTYAQYVTTREVLASSIQELGLDLDPDILAAAIRATANDVTRILTIRVQADDPQQASDLANTVATELEQLTSRGLSRPEGLVQIIEFAQPSPDPVAPQVSLIAILAAFAGVIVAIVLVLLLEYFGDTVRTGKEFATLARAPLLGTVVAPSGDPPSDADLVALVAPESRAAAHYRLISTKISLDPERSTVRSILVTDVDWEGQAAVIGTNLAATLGRSGRQVVLVDGAGVGGTLTRIQGWTDRDGLTDVVSSALTVMTPADGVRALPILPAGRSPIDTIDPDRLQEVIDGLAGDDGLVVLIGAPVQATPVTLALARVADSVVLVARRDRARRQDVDLATESLRAVGAEAAGVILTERSSLLAFRRDRRTGVARSTIPVEVGPATAPRGTGGRARVDRPTRSRTSTARSPRPMTLPDAGTADNVGAT